MATNYNEFPKHKDKPFRHTLANNDRQFTRNEHRPFAHDGHTEITYNLRSRIIFKRQQKKSEEKSYKNRRFGSINISTLLRNVKAKKDPRWLTPIPQRQKQLTKTTM